MRFLKINLSHPIVFDRFYSKYSKESKFTPEEWLDLFFNEHFWPSNSFEKYLQKDYGLETITIPLTYDRYNLNYIYFLENVITKIYPIEFDTSKQNTCIQNMITYFNPDILYLQETVFYSKEYLESTRRNCPNLKLILGWNCAPGTVGNMNKMSGFDLILTCSKEYYIEMKENHIDSVLIGHSFDESILKQLKKRTPKYDVTFTGHVATKDYRRKILQDISKSGLNINLFVEDAAQKHFDIPIKKQLFGLEMYQAIADSKIVLNIHALKDQPYSGNIRLYEVTGVGSLLLSDFKNDLNDKFDIDSEISSFKDSEEAIEKIKFLLNNEKKREEIAKKGQEKTLNNYSYKNRVAHLYKEISNRI